MATLHTPTAPIAAHYQSPTVIAASTIAAPQVSNNVQTVPAVPSVTPVAKKTPTTKKAKGSARSDKGGKHNYPSNRKAPRRNTDPSKPRKKRSDAGRKHNYPKSRATRGTGSKGKKRAISSAVPALAGAAVTGTAVTVPIMTGADLHAAKKAKTNVTIAGVAADGSAVRKPRSDKGKTHNYPKSRKTKGENGTPLPVQPIHHQPVIPAAPVASVPTAAAISAHHAPTAAAISAHPAPTAALPVLPTAASVRAQ